MNHSGIKKKLSYSTDLRKFAEWYKEFYMSETE